MYPFHASPSLPGCHSSMDSTKEKPPGLWVSWLSFLSLSPSFSLRQPLPSTASPPLTTARARQHHWSLYCLITWLQSSSPGVTAWLEVQWQLWVIWVELIVLFSLLFNNTPPPHAQISLPSPKPCPWHFWGGPKCMSKHKHRFKLTKHTDIN